MPSCLPVLDLIEMPMNVQDLVDTYAYVQQFPAAFAPLKPQFNLTAISELYNTTDFIGISSYPSLTPNFSTQQLEAATQQFDFEIGQFGIDLKTLNVKQVISFAVHRSLTYRQVVIKLKLVPSNSFPYYEC